MPSVTLWITRLQAVALVGLAIAVAVLAATSTSTLAPGFVISEIVVALLVAVLLAAVQRTRRVRTPILLLEVIAIGVAVQLGLDHRLPIAVVVGLPALVAVVGILLDARDDA